MRAARPSRTPVIHQSEAGECGLACIAMVANAHGLEVDLPTLRRWYSISLRGATLRSLIQISEQLGFHARPLRGEVGDLARIAAPTILHWDLNHFVVLTGVRNRLGKRRFQIHDPARGALSLSEAELSRHFTGVILELAKAQGFSPGRATSELRISQLWTRLTGFKRSLLHVLVLSLAMQVAVLAAPFYLQLAIDTVLPSADDSLLLLLAIGFGGLALIGVAISWARSLALISLGTALSYQMIANLNRHLLRLPLRWFEKRHVGDIISRFSSTNPVSHLISRALVASIIDGLLTFVTFTLMLVYSPLLTLAALLSLAVIALSRAIFLRLLRHQNFDAIMSAAIESSNFIEGVRGIEAIKSFGLEDRRHLRWQQTKVRAVNAQVRLARLSAGLEAFTQIATNLDRIVFVYLAVNLAMEGLFTVGMIFAFQAYKQQFMEASTRLVDQAMSLAIMKVHLSRIADIALAPAEPSGPAALHKFREATGRIELRRVRYAYGTGERNVLNDVDLAIEEGSLIVLVGPSGGGKTTLLKIMMGLFSPTSGQVVAGGQRLLEDNAIGWRRRIGTLGQDDVLFKGSLAENVASFDPEIDMERVAEVCRMASIANEIEAMPLGYETMVGDMGSALSGGQRQRVLLARALYHDPIALFIDEGTAHLDPRSELEVLKAIGALPITRVMTTHRAAPLAFATAVFDVTGGNVIRKAPAETVAELA